MFVNRRSIQIAKNIEEKIESGLCSVGILIVGAFHLHKMLAGQTASPVSQLLSEYGIKSQSYAVFSGDSCNPDDFFSMSGSLCSRQKLYGKGNSAQVGSPTSEAKYDGAFLGERTTEP